MPITGGVKFFTGNKVLAADGGTIVASSGQIVAESAIDKNPITVWTSVGSNDATTETLTLTFNEVEINRLLLQHHNFKDFNIQYWNGAAWAHFAGVVGLDGSLANITETAFADDTAYYEFDPVTTTQLRLQILKTHVANAQKFIAQIIACTELGTFEGFPRIRPLEHDRNERIKEMLTGKVLVQKGVDSFACKIDMNKYPPDLSGDLDLAMTLFDSEDPFLVWLCGGRRGGSYFRYTLRGFRLRDIYLMQLVKRVSLEYHGGGYLNPVSVDLHLREHV